MQDRAIQYVVFPARYGPFTAAAERVGVTLPLLRTAYFVRLGHPLLEKRQVLRSDLAQYDFVVPAVSRPSGTDIRDIFESEGIEPVSRMHAVDYFPLVKLMVARSDAIGVVSVNHGRSPAFAAKFGLIDLKRPITPSALCCAVRTRWDPPPIVRSFIAACRKTLPEVLQEP